MAPFVHCSKLYPRRFSDGNYGIFYAANSEQVALAETIHHHVAFMSNSSATPCWTSGFRVLVGSIDRELHDVDAVLGACDPDDYRLSQRAGKALRDAGSDDLTWTSARNHEVRCIGVFRPDVSNCDAMRLLFDAIEPGDRVRHSDRVPSFASGKATV